VAQAFGIRLGGLPRPLRCQGFPRLSRLIEMSAKSPYEEWQNNPRLFDDYIAKPFTSEKLISREGAAGIQGDRAVAEGNR